MRVCRVLTAPETGKQLYVWVAQLHCCGTAHPPWPWVVTAAPRALGFCNAEQTPSRAVCVHSAVYNITGKFRIQVASKLNRLQASQLNRRGNRGTFWHVESIELQLLNTLGGKAAEFAARTRYASRVTCKRPFAPSWTRFCTVGCVMVKPANGRHLQPGVTTTAAARGQALLAAAVLLSVGAWWLMARSHARLLGAAGAVDTLWTAAATPAAPTSPAGMQQLVESYKDLADMVSATWQQS